MSVIGLGVDIVEIDRMARALERSPRFRFRVFSEGERAYCDSTSRPEVHYALRFAAKEAVLKALGTGFSGMRFCDVEVVRDPRGKPSPLLHGRAAEVAHERGIIEWHLSLSYTHATAVASVVAVTQGGRPAPPQEGRDPYAELAQSFKEARALLDDIGTDGSDADDPTEPDGEVEADVGDEGGLDA